MLIWGLFMVYNVNYMELKMIYIYTNEWFFN